MGSGKLISAAIKKYGVENFSKEILHVFETEEEMNAKEAELVEVGEHSYNMCPGGKGGWGYVNENRPHGYYEKLGRITLEKYPDLVVRWQTAGRAAAKKRWETDPWRTDTFTGRTHAEETKRKISETKRGSGVGEKNSQFGTFWITNGIDNAKSSGYIPEGWRRGRIRS